MAAKEDIKDEAEFGLNNVTEENEKDLHDEEDEDIMLDAKENLDDQNSLRGCDNDEMSYLKNQESFDESAILAEDENDNKVFYLFTRTAREKEEWLNHLMVAAKFMEDWERQNPKEGSPSPVDTDYETQKVNNDCNRYAACIFGA